MQYFIVFLTVFAGCIVAGLLYVLSTFINEWAFDDRTCDVPVYKAIISFLYYAFLCAGFITLCVWLGNS